MDVSDLKSLEFKVIWEYIGFDPPLHFRRTLDQFGYPSLRDTYARDDDQILYKLTKDEPTQRVPLFQSPARPGGPPKGTPRSQIPPGATHIKVAETSDEDSNSDDMSQGADVMDGKVIMVDQLWLWAIDKSKFTTLTIAQTRYNDADLPAKRPW
jgi:hypothetical protein